MGGKDTKSWLLRDTLNWILKKVKEAVKLESRFRLRHQPMKANRDSNKELQVKDKERSPCIVTGRQGRPQS